jgi:hypothetical protein
VQKLYNNSLGLTSANHSANINISSLTVGSHNLSSKFCDGHGSSIHCITNLYPFYKITTSQTNDGAVYNGISTTLTLNISNANLITGATLNWNGSIFTPTKTSSSGLDVYSQTITVPLAINSVLSNWTFNINGYNFTTSTINQTVSGTILLVNVSDETTGALINSNLSIQMTNNISTTTKTIINQTNFTNYDRASQIHINGGVYGSRTYNIPAPATPITYLNLYLLNTSLPNINLITFTIYDAAFKTLEGVQVVISKLYGTNTLNLSTPQTNFQGQFQEYMDTTTNYHFELSKEGYLPKSFDWYPADLTPSIILSSNNPFAFNNSAGDVIYSIYPQSSVIPTNDTAQFILTTSSASGYLNTFGAWTNFNGSTTIINLTTSTGGSAILMLNTTPYNDTTIIIHYFMTTQGGSWEINRSYYLYNAAYGGNQTVAGIFTNLIPEISPLYRFLIAIIISLIVGAAFFSLIGVAGSTMIAWGVFASFAALGFISWIFPIFAGILGVIGYIVLGGPDGT